MTNEPGPAYQLITISGSRLELPVHAHTFTSAEQAMNYAEEIIEQHELIKKGPWQQEPSSDPDYPAYFVKTQDHTLRIVPIPKRRRRVA